MSVIIAEHKCITCRHFDQGDNECTNGVMCLNLLNQYEVISECDFWESRDEGAENE